MRWSEYEAAVAHMHMHRFYSAKLSHCLTLADQIVGITASERKQDGGADNVCV